MIGSMLEGPIAIAAGVHFAVSTPGVILTDLDMDLDMQAHTKGQVKFFGGKRIPNLRPGLGVFPDYDKIDNLISKKILIFKRLNLKHHGKEINHTSRKQTFK